MNQPTDIIGQPVNVGDYVVCYNHIYEVLIANPTPRPRGPLRLMLAKPSKTTRPITKHSGDVVVLDNETVKQWIFKE